MTRLLVIKTSSMGDIVHALVAVAEAKKALPDLEIEWVVEEAFADIPALFPGLYRVIPVAFRRWKKQPFAGITHREKLRALRPLKDEPYDVVIDAQGLMKSAYIAGKTGTPKNRRWGFDWSSARESLASLSVGHHVHAPPEMHAVERMRRLFSKALGYPPRDFPPTGLHLAGVVLADEFKNLCQRMGISPGDAGRCVLLCHGTSREEKAWPGDRWRKLGKELAARGMLPIFPSGTPEERRRAKSYAESTGGVWMPTFTLREIGCILQHVPLVIGVDTGLTHWAAALGRYTVLLLTDTPASRYGLDWSVNGATLSGTEIMPEEILEQLDQWKIGLIHGDQGILPRPNAIPELAPPVVPRSPPPLTLYDV